MRNSGLAADRPAEAHRTPSTLSGAFYKGNYHVKGTQLVRRTDGRTLAICKSKRPGYTPFYFRDFERVDSAGKKFTFVSSVFQETGVSEFEVDGIRYSVVRISSSGEEVEISPLRYVKHRRV